MFIVCIYSVLSSLNFFTLWLNCCHWFWKNINHYFFKELFWDFKHKYHLVLYHGSYMFCSVWFILISFCVSVWVISIDLFSNVPILFLSGSFTEDPIISIYHFFMKQLPQLIQLCLCLVLIALSLDCCALKLFVKVLVYYNHEVHDKR